MPKELKAMTRLLLFHFSRDRTVYVLRTSRTLMTFRMRDLFKTIASYPETGIAATFAILVQHRHMLERNKAFKRPRTQQ